MSDNVEIGVEAEPYIHPRDEARIKGHYFDNYLVEQLVTKYVMGGCTNRKLRDEIMTHANELIRQIIRTHNLNDIYPGNDPASFGDLEQVAWCVAPDTLVFTDNGICRIDETVFNNYGLIYGKDGMSKIKDYVYFTNKEVRTITTKYGYSLTAGLKHPIWCMGDRWINIEDIKIGDMVAIQVNQQCKPDKRPTHTNSYDQMTRMSILNVGLLIDEGFTEVNILPDVNNIIWLPITKIEDGFSDTIDIETDSHTFTANGIITHNCQLESMLYKFDHGPNHTKLFNLWSQVCKTVILAYIKKETRDRKNFPTYKGHVVNKGARPEYKLERFAEEARLVCGNNLEYNLILDAIIHLHKIDDKPYDGMIGKLVDISKLSRTKVSGFLKYLRYRQRDFSDAPVNDESSAMNKLVYDDGRRKTYNTESDDD